LIGEPRIADDLPAPWPDVFDALSGITHANRELHKLIELIRERHDSELAEIRDGMLALSNRIEALTNRHA
jgi:hypothetical protein